LDFEIWNLDFPSHKGTGLFLKVIRKDPFILCAYYFEADFAIGTEDEIPGSLVSFQRDIGITDRTFQFRGHGWPPLSYLVVLIFEIQEKIKSFPLEKLMLSPVIPEGWMDRGGDN